MNLDLNHLDWRGLERLRAQFLAGDASPEDYWQRESDLASYDATFAQRIGWKWDYVLAELARRGWSPPVGELLDWGCGSGIAGRAFLDHFGAGAVTALRVWDRSPLAMQFAARRAREKYPGLEVTSGAELAGPPFTLLLSHVLSELTPEAIEALLRLAATAQCVLWVEPGTYDVSRALIALRERLRSQLNPNSEEGKGQPRMNTDEHGWKPAQAAERNFPVGRFPLPGVEAQIPSAIRVHPCSSVVSTSAFGFNLVAPCTHQAACGLLAAGNERHWCHHFAAPPPGVFTDGNWSRFANLLGIDLRDLPLSFLVLDRRPAPALPAGATRILGHPRIYKPHALLLSCDASGVRERKLTQRALPAEFRRLKKGSCDPLQVMQCEGGVVTATRPLSA